MKNSFLLFCLFSFLISYEELFAQKVDLSQTDVVRVWLFSDIQVNELQLTAKNAPFEMILDDKSPIEIDTSQKLTIKQQKGGFHISNNGKNYFGKTIQLINDEIGLIQLMSKDSGYRYYRGTLILNQQTGLRPLNKISLEDYVASVVGSEMNFTHPEALKVQAVISRTYALWNLANAKKSWYDVTDHTMSQVYNGELITKPYFRNAALATSGEIATFDNRVILAVFSSTCGGHTSNNETAWRGKPLPYLRGISDNDACKNSPHFRWEFALPIQNWNQWTQQTFGTTLGVPKIISTSPDERVDSVGFASSNRKMKANDLRLKMIKSFGALSLKSTHFTVESHQDSIIFNGKGLGHGIGLCQWGALGMAEAGWKYKDILHFYYGGIEIKDVYYDFPKMQLEVAN